VFCTYKVYLVQKNNFSMETHVEVPEKSTRGDDVCGQVMRNPGTTIFAMIRLMVRENRSRMTCENLIYRKGQSKVSTTGQGRSRRSTE